MTKHSIHLISGNALDSLSDPHSFLVSHNGSGARQTHALARQAPMTTAKSMTGARSTARLLSILGFRMIRDGSVTPAVNTCIPRTILVNCREGDQLLQSQVPDRQSKHLPIEECSSLDRSHLRPPSFRGGCIIPCRTGQHLRRLIVCRDFNALQDLGAEQDTCS